MITALDEQRAVGEKLPRRIRTLYETLGELGPVHAGDPELLERVRASRPWVVTRLKELEESGLVRSERDSGRVLYEVTTDLLLRPAGRITTTAPPTTPKGSR